MKLFFGFPFCDNIFNFAVLEYIKRKSWFEMETLYIDIFFLINFTVDIVSLYFAALFSKIRTSNCKLILSSLLGAISACALILIDSFVINLIIAVMSFLIMLFICCGRVKLKRTAIFGVSFLIFMSLIGGFVSSFWDLMSGVFEKYIIPNDQINRKVFFLAIIILLSIGVFKMFITVINTSNVMSSISFQIEIENKVYESEAMIDTGNLAIDPMSMRPVLIIKKTLAKKFLSDDIIDLSNIDEIPLTMKKRIRLIPISRCGETHVLLGIRPDSVKIKTDTGYEEIDVTIAIDKEGGDYGGFLGLMPGNALQNVNTSNN